MHVTAMSPIESHRTLRNISCSRRYSLLRVSTRSWSSVKIALCCIPRMTIWCKAPGASMRDWRDKRVTDTGFVLTC